VLWSEFADGAFAELDPFTGMIWPADLEEFNKTTQGEFSGVGIQIQSDDDGSLKVVSPLEDSPAYKAGIKAGDLITHINGKNAKGITLNQAVKTITGPKGTQVVLTVASPGGKTKEYTIKRETIKVASVKGWLHLPGGGWEYLVDPENKIAYLRMTNFTKDTAKELDKAVSEIEARGGRGIILDLRYNPGGLLTAATDVSDKFLRRGDIVSTRPERDNGNQQTIARARADDNDTTLPLVVLVNQYSASASEIVSGALKDQSRALVVGERTFGKGSVQMLFPLSDRSAYLKLTTSHYYLPSGRCIHREETSTEWGVDPDVTVEMTPEQMRAAIDARQELDILRDANAAPAEGKQEKINDVAPKVQEEVNKQKEKEVANAKDPGGKKDLLSSDPQLSAAVLLLRLQLTGTQL
jgi:carboxyl-terminal processing protease